MAIIIIDWDCAHHLIEGRFYTKVVQALEEHIPTLVLLISNGNLTNGTLMFFSENSPYHFFLHSFEI